MSSRGVLRGLLVASPKFSEGFLELVLTGNWFAGVGANLLLPPFSPGGASESVPESTRATVRSLFPAGDGSGDSNTPILSRVAFDCGKASLEGG